MARPTKAAAPKRRRARRASTEGDPQAAYLMKFVSAFVEVNEAQQKWVDTVDAASYQPALVNDPEWQTRSAAALSNMLAAADQLAIDPVPDAANLFQQVLDEARQEARMAALGYNTLLESSDLGSLLAAVRHTDRMAALLERAYAAVRPN